MSEVVSPLTRKPFQQHKSHTRGIISSHINFSVVHNGHIYFWEFTAVTLLPPTPLITLLLNCHEMVYEISLTQHFGEILRRAIFCVPNQHALTKRMLPNKTPFPPLCEVQYEAPILLCTQNEKSNEHFCIVNWNVGKRGEVVPTTMGEEQLVACVSNG